MDEQANQLEHMLDRLRVSKVVSLRRYRQLRIRLDRARADRLLAEIRAELRAMAIDSFMARGALLTDWIDSACRRHRVPSHRRPLWLAHRLVANGYFMRLGQQCRRLLAEVREVPTTEVKAHVREGRPVRAHFRCLGHDHLLALALGDCSDPTRDVLVLLAAGIQQREGST